MRVKLNPIALLIITLSVSMLNLVQAGESVACLSQPAQSGVYSSCVST